VGGAGIGRDPDAAGRPVSILRDSGTARMVRREVNVETGFATREPGAQFVRTR
jgi:hypothetical protein